MSTKTWRLSRFTEVIVVYTGVIWQVVFFCALWVSTHHPLMASRMLLLCVNIHNENQSYTDMHDVDENALSISRGGGWQSHGSFAGVAHRDMYHSPSYVSDYVASSNIQKYEIIRISIMSTKTWSLYHFTVDIGSMKARQVSRIEIRMIFLIFCPV